MGCGTPFPVRRSPGCRSASHLVVEPADCSGCGRPACRSPTSSRILAPGLRHPCGTLPRASNADVFRLPPRARLSRRGVRGTEMRRDLLRQALGNLFLAHLRPVLDTVGSDEMHLVADTTHDAARARHVIGDDQVGALAVELRPGIFDEVLGLGGEADDKARTLGMVADGLQYVGVLGKFRAGADPSPVFLIFCVPGALGTPVRDRRDQTAMSAGSSACTASRISSARSTWMVETPAGSGMATGPATSRTSAPSRARAAAMAWPWRPDERLAM